MNKPDYQVLESKDFKQIKSENFNLFLNKKDGQMFQWGKTKEEDPEMCPFGPIIADIEITTKCYGINGVVCPFCYKANTPNGEYMTIERFKEVFDCINKGKTLTQIAFGVDSHCATNPDVWKIMEYSKEHNVQPNVTVAEIDDEVAQNIAKYCGACAVSFYGYKIRNGKEYNPCYESIEKLHQAGMKQINIHLMISEETFPNVKRLIEDFDNVPALKYVRAVVFLSLKQKGRGVGFHRLSDDKYEWLVKTCFEKHIGIGFDSCGAKKFNDYTIKTGINKTFKSMIIPCESTLFSTYLDVKGNFYPCSFCEKIEGWEEGIPVTKDIDFYKDVWFNERVIQFRKNLLENKDCNGCRMCPIYNV